MPYNQKLEAFLDDYVNGAYADFNAHETIIPLNTQSFEEALRLLRAADEAQPGLYTIDSSESEVQVDVADLLANGFTRKEIEEFKGENGFKDRGDYFFLYPDYHYASYTPLGNLERMLPDTSTERQEIWSWSINLVLAPDGTWYVLRHAIGYASEKEFVEEIVGLLRGDVTTDDLSAWQLLDW